MERPGLRELVEDLQRVDEVTWGKYAFSRDLLRDKVPVSAQKEMIAAAICCGEQKAEQIIRRQKTADPWRLARAEGIRVEKMPPANIGGTIFFALFTAPDLIRIAEGVVEKAPLKESGLPPQITKKTLYSLLLAHELYHYFENRDDSLYTSKTKIVLWRLPFYRHCSTVRALSEIGAMAFAKRINSVSCSPFILDFLLAYPDHPEGVYETYGEIKKMLRES